MKRLWITLTCIGLTSAVWAAAPPEYINYQGVLRDALNNPLDGDHDMVFRLYDAQTLGNLLLTDSHTSTDPPPVEPVNVTGGLFNAHLGEGHPTAGVYNTLAEVFASEGGVWLEIQVGNEVLSPRVRVIAAAYALNADHLDGRDSTGFLDTSSSTQYKTGTVIFDASSQPNLGVEATGLLSSCSSLLPSALPTLRFGQPFKPK